MPWLAVIYGTDGVLVWASDGKDPESCTVRLCKSGADRWTEIAAIPRVDTAQPYRDLVRAFK